MMIKHILLMVFVQISSLVFVKSSKLVDSAVVVANKSFDPSRVTAVSWNQKNIDHATEFLKKYNGSVIITPLNNNKANVLKVYEGLRYKQLVFFAGASDEFEVFMLTIRRLMVITIRVILVVTEPIEELAQLSDFTATAWDNDIGHIAIVSADDGDNNVLISTYFPYGNGSCRNMSPVPLNGSSEDYFPRKFNNFYGCPIRTTVVHYPPLIYVETDDNGSFVSMWGLDGGAIIIVLEAINATNEVASFKNSLGPGTYFPNGTATGLLGELYYGSADLAAAMVITEAGHSVAQMSYVYRSVRYSWYGPNQREIHRWAKVFLPFYNNITPFLVLAFIAFVIATKVIRRYALCQPKRNRGVFFITFVLFLGQDIKYETKCWLVNTLFVFWIWFCLLLRIAYQGDLVNGLQKTILEPALGSFEDAVKVVDGYGGNAVVRELIKGSSIEDKFRVLFYDEVPGIFNEIADGKRFLLAGNPLLVEYFARKVQVLEEPLVVCFICMHLRPGWSAAKEIDRMVFRAAEAGLLDQIYRAYNEEWTRHREMNTPDDKEPAPLGMGTLGACFYGILVLYMICVVIFCGEIVYFKYNLKNKLKCKVR